MMCLYVQEERQVFAPDRFGGCGGKDKVTYYLEIRIYTYKHHLHTYIFLPKLSHLNDTIVENLPKLIKEEINLNIFKKMLKTFLQINKDKFEDFLDYD